MARSPDVPSLTLAALYGSKAPSTRARLLEWAQHLQLRDVEELFHADLGDLRPLTIAGNMRGVIRAERRVRRQGNCRRPRLLLSREAALLSRGTVEETLLSAAAHSAYDIDDALFQDVRGHRGLYARPSKARRAAAAADVVIAGNEYLASWAGDYSRDVRVIPTCIDPSMYTPKSTWDVDGPPVLIWLGSPSTERYVAEIAPQLAEIHRISGARVRLISGARETRYTAGLDFLDRVPWSLHTFAAQLRDGDVAIAPLDDTPWSRGKCAYKLLQYAATGLPIVGSPVGANERALRLFDGLSVTRKDDWVEAVMSVLQEPQDRRKRRGLAGVAEVARHYSFDAWRDNWKQAVGFA